MGVSSVELSDDILSWEGSASEQSASEQSASEQSARSETESNLHLYLREISRVALLTAAEEQELARAIEQGARASAAAAECVDETEAKVLQAAVRTGRRARERLTAANLRLVVSIACRYQGRGLSLPDLIQEGNLGLMRAVTKFDYRLGNRFSTYATWWIRQSLLRGLADHGRTVRLPVHVVESIGRTLRTQQRLQSHLGREPHAAELADALNVPKAQVERDMRAAPLAISLDAAPDDDGELALVNGIADDRAEDPVGEAMRADTLSWLRRALSLLPNAQADVLEWRYGLRDGVGRTLDEIAGIRGVSRERIRQLEVEAIRTLRQKLKRAEAPLD